MGARPALAITNGDKRFGLEPLPRPLITLVTDAARFSDPWPRMDEFGATRCE